MSRRLAPPTDASPCRAERTERTEPPSALRCLVVWALLSVAVGTVSWLCLGELVRTTTTSAAQQVVAEQSVVLVACVGGLLASLYVWVVASLAVLDTLRGRAAGTPPLGAGPAARSGRAVGAGTVRRLTLLACGVAVSAGAALPSYAADPGTTPSTSELAVLDGLPYPDRAATTERARASEEVVVRHEATGARPEPTAARERAGRERAPQADARTVRPGDSLWAIASEVSSSRDAGVVAQQVDQLHRANRAVIGDDPDLILPGQRLSVPPSPRTPQSHPSTTDRSQEGPR